MNTMQEHHDQNNLRDIWKTLSHSGLATSATENCRMCTDDLITAGSAAKCCSCLKMRFPVTRLMNQSKHDHGKQS